MARLAIEQGRLIGLMIGLVFFGMYTCLFAFLLTTSPGGGRRRNVIRTVMWLLWILTLLCMIFICIDIYVGFLLHEAGANDYFKRRHWPVWGIASDLTMMINSVIADSFICWRLYVIWNKNKYILIPPVFFLVTGLSFGCVSITMEFQEMAQKAGRYWARVLLWGRMAFGMTFILNILATTLICWKIWLISKNVSGTTKRMDVLYVGLVRALIESGAILTASIALYLIIISINPVAGSLVAASIPVAIGVAPTFCVMKIQLMADESHVTSEDPATTTVPVALQVSEPVWQTGRSTQLSPMAFALESVKTSNVATNWEDDHSSSPSKREVDLLPDLGQDHKPPTSLSLV